MIPIDTSYYKAIYRLMVTEQHLSLGNKFYSIGSVAMGISM